MKYCLVLLILCLAATTAWGQTHQPPVFQTPCEDTLTFGLRALDTDSMYMVKLMPDSYHKTATLFLSRINFLKINNVWRLDSIIGHGKNFTEIQLRLQAAEGTHKIRKIIFCIIGGKLHTALDIFAAETGHPDGFIDVTKDSAIVHDQTLNYNVAINVRSTGGIHSVILNETRHMHSEKDSTKNTSFEKSYELKFDTDHHVFYDSLIALNQKYSLVSSKDTTSQVSIDGKTPSIKLYYPDNYYFINGGWYTGTEGVTTLNLRE